MSHIFISYRSTDVPYAAALLDNALVHHFGAKRVFRDSRSLHPGDVFDPEIMEAVRQSAVMLVVIGPGWTGRSATHGQRQIDDPNDFIHRELVEAFNHGVQVVPILIEVPRLQPTDLPADLQFLTKRQDRTIRMRESAADVTSLIAALSETLPDFAAPQHSQKTTPDHTIKADKIGAIFNDKVRITGDLNIK